MTTFNKSIISSLFIVCLSTFPGYSAKRPPSENLKESSNQPTKYIKLNPEPFHPSLTTHLAHYLSGNIGHNDPSIINPIVDRMSKTWIRNASDYIFSNDLRSFLELVVNACDATLELNGLSDRAVGKFGMGFFSFFSLLRYKDFKNAQIDLTTTYKDKDGTLSSYKLIFCSGDTYDVKVTHQKMEAAEKTGTKITFSLQNEASRKTFSDEDINKLREYTYYLQFYQFIKINLLTQKSLSPIRETLGNIQAPCEINVTISPTKLEVEDFGTGISEEIATRSLLIPSLSSKGLTNIKLAQEQSLKQKAPLPYLSQWKGKADPKKSHFLITVNDVIVINKELDQPISSQNSSCTNDLILPMPQATQLTLARDELCITIGKANFEEKMLNKIIKETISEALSNQNQNIPLIPFYECIKTWEKQSSATHINGLFSGYFKQEFEDQLNQNKKIPAPIKYSSFLDMIFNKHLNNETYQLCPLSGELINYNFNQLKKLIHELACQKAKQDQSHQEIRIKALQEEIIVHHTVIFVPDEFLPQSRSGKAIMSNLGLAFYLFVPESLLNNLPQENTERVLADAIISRYTDYVITQPEYTPYKQNHIINTQQEPDENLLLNQDKEKLEKPDEQAIFVISEEVYNEINPENPLKKAIEEKGPLPPFLQAAQISHSHLFNDQMPNHKRFSNLLILLLAIHNILKPKIATQATILNSFIEETSPYDIGEIYDISMNDTNDEELRGKLINMLENSSKKDHSIPLNTIINILIEQANRCGGKWSYEGLTTHDIARESIQNLNINEQVNKSLFSLSLHHKNISSLWPIETNNIEQINTLSSLLFKNCPMHLKKNPLAHEQTDKSYIKHWLHNTPKKEILTHQFTNSDAIANECSIKYNAILRHSQFITRSPIISLTTNARAQDFNDCYEIIKEAITLSDHHNQRLENIIESIDITVSTHPLINILLLIAHAKNISPHNTNQQTLFNEISKFIRSLLSCYHNYYDIKDEDLSQSYGTKITYAATKKFNQVKISMIYDVLETLVNEKEHTPDHFTYLDKILKFTLESQTSEMDPEKQKENLGGKHSLHQPSIACSGGLHDLANLAQQYSSSKELKNKLIISCVRHAKTNKELTLISNILAIQEVAHIIQTASNKNSSDNFFARLDHLIKHFISYFIREKIELGSIDLNNESNSYRFKKEATTYFEDKLNISSQFLDQSNLFNVETAHPNLSCTLDQLLSAHCAGSGIVELLEKEDLARVNSITQEYTSGKFSSKITQAVECGSERFSFLAASIEILQNASDAIKLFLKQDQEDIKKSLDHRINKLGIDKKKAFTEVTKTYITLGFIPSLNNNENSHAVVTYTDNIGMNLETLLTNLLIPDYSTKSGDSTGIMGNGAFQIYKEAHEVHFITRSLNNPDKVYRLQVIPLRNENNIVYDLQLFCTDISNEAKFENFYGTSISIKFQDKHHEEKTAFDLLANQHVLQNYISSFNIPLNMPEIPKENRVKYTCDSDSEDSDSDEDDEYSTTSHFEIIYTDTVNYNMNITQNGNVLNQPPSSNDIIVKQLDTKEKSIESYLRKENQPSFVLTNGIPLTSLSPFVRKNNLLPSHFIEDIDRGLILNIPSNCYHPVQSRTQIKMKEQTIKEIRRILFDSLYIKLINSISNNKESYLLSSFTHFYSTSTSLEQLKLSSFIYERVNQEINNWINQGKISESLSMEKFVTYYKARNMEKEFSFYEEQKECCDHFFPILTGIKILVLIQKEEIIENAKNKVPLEELNERLNKLYNEIDANVHTKLKEWKNTIKTNQAKYQPLIKNIIIPWISRKIKKIRRVVENMEPKDKNKQDKNKNHTISSEQKTVITGTDETQHIEKAFEIIRSAVEKIQNLFLSCYVHVFKELASQEFTEETFRVKSTYWSAIDYNIRAGWNPSDETIQVNTKSPILMSDFLKFITTDFYEEKISTFDMNKCYNDLFGINQINSVGHIIHELEHARRGFSHDAAGHHDSGIDAEGNEASFDLCAKSYAIALRKIGLTEEWVKEFKEKASEDEIQVIRKNIDLIKEHEKITKAYS